MRRIVAMLAALFALAGCSAGTPEPIETKGDTGAEAFVACLKSEGVEAKIGSFGGMVMVRTGTAIPDEDGVMTQSQTSDTPVSLMSEFDDEGNIWEAPQDSSYFANDPDTQDAYAACEARFPDFAQPEFDPMSDPDTQAMQQESEQAALDFAICAREHDFAWVSDPDPATGSAIEIPATLTEGEFRSLLESCFDPAAPGFAWSVPIPEPFDWNAVLDEFVDFGTD